MVLESGVIDKYEYNEEDVFRLGKRYGNKKRKYLLINPLQAKYIPVQPSDSIRMMRTLGNRVAAQHSGAKLVIGFAETATAVGAVVASCLGDDCVYIHTTREDIDNINDWIEFKEEHSHAVEQRLFAKDIGKYIANTEEIIIVDDELSTGNTIINLVNKLKDRYADIEDKKIIAAFIISKLSESNIRRLAKNGIECEYLVGIKERDYDNIANNIIVASPVSIMNKDISSTFESTMRNVTEDYIDSWYKNTRLGVNIKEYTKSCMMLANKIVKDTISEIGTGNNILILGTEEFMYPALMVGLDMEKSGNMVKVHATGRSPIGINGIDGYPIEVGYKIPSLYDSERESYVYNLSSYDKVIVLTDSTHCSYYTMEKLAYVLKKHGNNKITFIKWG